MRKTIVLMGSPRLQSNTDILAQKIVEGIRSVGADDDIIEQIDLVEMQNYVCCACGRCRAAGECMQFPQVTEKLKKIKEADGLVIATPVWWLGMSSCMKIFIDHWGTFLRPDYSSRIAGKRAVLAAVCGNPQVNLAEKVCDDLRQILSYLDVKVVGSLSVMGVAEHAAINRDQQSLDSAFELGVALYTK